MSLLSRSCDRFPRRPASELNLPGPNLPCYPEVLLLSHIPWRHGRLEQGNVSSEQTASNQNLYIERNFIPFQHFLFVAVQLLHPVTQSAQHLVARKGARTFS